MSDTAPATALVLLALLSAGRSWASEATPVPVPSGRLCVATMDADLMWVTEADVTIESPRLATPIRTRTDGDGRARVAGLAPGTYHLLAERPGFSPARAEVTVEGGRSTAGVLWLAVDPESTYVPEGSWSIDLRGDESIVGPPPAPWKERATRAADVGTTMLTVQHDPDARALARAGSGGAERPPTDLVRFGDLLADGPALDAPPADGAPVALATHLIATSSTHFLRVSLRARDGEDAEAVAEGIELNVTFDPAWVWSWRRLGAPDAYRTAMDLHFSRYANRYTTGDGPRPGELRAGDSFTAFFELAPAWNAVGRAAGGVAPAAISVQVRYIDAATRAPMSLGAGVPFRPVPLARATVAVRRSAALAGLAVALTRDSEDPFARTTIAALAPPDTLWSHPATWARRQLLGPSAPRRR